MFLRAALLAALLALFPYQMSIDPLLNRQDVQRAITRVWEETRAKSDGTEYCFTVENQNIVFYTGKPYSCTMDVSGDMDATFHTHPTESAEQPSALDREDAERIGIPFYVISKRAIWVAMPDGTAHLVLLRGSQDADY